MTSKFQRVEIVCSLWFKNSISYTVYRYIHNPSLHISYSQTWAKNMNNYDYTILFSLTFLCQNSVPSAFSSRSRFEHHIHYPALIFLKTKVVVKLYQQSTVPWLSCAWVPKGNYTSCKLQEENNVNCTEIWHKYTEISIKYHYGTCFFPLIIHHAIRKPRSLTQSTAWVLFIMTQYLYFHMNYLA